MLDIEIIYYHTGEILSRKFIFAKDDFYFISYDKNGNVSKETRSTKVEGGKNIRVSYGDFILSNLYIDDNEDQFGPEELFDENQEVREIYWWNKGEIIFRWKSGYYNA